MPDIDAIDALPARIAYAVVGTLGVGSFLVFPSIAVGLKTALALGDQQIGMVSTAQLIGLAGGALSCLWFLRRVDWRLLAALGIALIALAELACSYATQLAPLLGCRFVAGFGGGLSIAFGAYALGQTRRPDSAFAMFMAVQVLFAIAGALGLPGVLAAQGVRGIFAILAACALVTLVALVPRIPRVRWQAQPPGGGNDRRRWFLCLAVLVGIMLFFTAIGGFWTFIGPIAVEAGLAPQVIGNSLSIALLAAFAGSVTSAMLGARLTRAGALALAIGLQLLGLWLLADGFDQTGFIVAACVFMFGWYVANPVQFALLASIDRDGRPLVLGNFFAGLGTGSGPALVGLLLTGEGYRPAYVVCAIFSCLALAVQVGVYVAERRSN